MKCKICKLEAKEIFKATLLKKHNDIKYFHCNTCGFLQTEEPFWLEEAYSPSRLTFDTGAVSRNINLSKTSSALIYFLFDKDRKFLDFAGGNGIFTRMMRDIGFDFYLCDLYAQNLFATGFEYSKKIENINLITAFECFEHFINPISEIENLLKVSSNILFTTQLLPDEVPRLENWWYYALEGGQHISFYSLKTMSFIAKQYGLYFSSHRGINLFTKNKINNFIFCKIIEWENLLFHFVKKRMRSRTQEDFKIIKNLL
jgi:hypothetical protein